MLIEDPTERERITGVIRDVVAAVDAQDVETIDDLADRAMLHAYVDDVVPDTADRATTDMSTAVQAYGQGRGGAGLHGGAARGGWLVAPLAGGEIPDPAGQPLDDARLRRIAK